MENLRYNLERYLNEALNITVKTQPWGGEDSLPFFLRNMYGFFQVSLLDTGCLVMAPRKEVEQTPATIRKHMLQVQKKWGDAVLYVSQKISTFNRKRLIENKVPFVVPGNQMYLPPLGIDLREHFRPPRNIRPKWRPSTQAAFLYAFIHAPKQGLTPKEMADRLGYVPMSMTRAFDDLEAAEVGQVVMEGRQRILRLDQDRRELWEKALGFLQSPVKKSVWVKLAANQRPVVEAGLTALARYSSLAEPANPVFALESKEWQDLRNLHDVMELPVAEPDACQLESWSYAPGLFAENGVADRLSLYLSLQDTDDERVASALAEMMEQVRW